MTDPTTPPIPAAFHDDPDAVLEYLTDADLQALADYLEVLKADFEAGKRTPTDSGRYLMVQNVPDEGENIGPLLDLAVYYGRVWERQAAQEASDD